MFTTTANLEYGRNVTKETKMLHPTSICTLKKPSTPQSHFYFSLSIYSFLFFIYLLIILIDRNQTIPMTKKKNVFRTRRNFPF